MIGYISSGPTKSSGESILASVGVPLLLASLFTVLFIVRSMAPRGMMKIGISMLQIVATANSVYTIPWPPAFSSFLDLMKIFLVCHRSRELWAEEGMGMQIYELAWDACVCDDCLWRCS